MRKRTKRYLDHDGMTLVEVMAAFFILMLASKAVFSCVSGYSQVIQRSRELAAAAVSLERAAGNAEYGTAAEIHLEIGGEEFVEPGYCMKVTESNSVRSVSGFWLKETAMEESLADEE